MFFRVSRILEVVLDGLSFLFFPGDPFNVWIVAGILIFGSLIGELLLSFVIVCCEGGLGGGRGILDLYKEIEDE